MTWKLVIHLHMLMYAMGVSIVLGISRFFVRRALCRCSQNAKWRVDGSPEVHQTDIMSFFPQRAPQWRKNTKPNFICNWAITTQHGDCAASLTNQIGYSNAPRNAPTFDEAFNMQAHVRWPPRDLLHQLTKRRCESV